MNRCEKNAVLAAGVSLDRLPKNFGRKILVFCIGQKSILLNIVTHCEKLLSFKISIEGSCCLRRFNGLNK